MVKILTAPTDRNGNPFLRSGLPAHADPKNRVGVFDPMHSGYNWKSSNTRRLRAALGKASTGGFASFGFLGDSLTFGAVSETLFARLASWPIAFRDYLSSIGVQVGGEGIVPCGTWPMNTAGAVDPRFSNYSAWVNNGGYLSAQASGVSLTFTTIQQCTSMDIYYYDTSGPFTVAIDGGAPVTVTPAGTFQILKYTIGNLPRKIHQMVITTTSTALTAFAGVGSGSGEGLHVHALGSYGSQAQDWANGTDITLAPRVNRNMLALQNPSAVFMSLGPNDLTNNRTVAQLKTDMGTLISSYVNSSDVVLCNAYQPSSLSTAQVENLARTFYELADQYDVPLFDMYDRVGPYAVASANGLIGPDNIHMREAGYRDWGSTVASLSTVGGLGVKDNVAKLAGPANVVVLGPTDPIPEGTAGGVLIARIQN